MRLHLQLERMLPGPRLWLHMQLERMLPGPRLWSRLQSLVPQLQRVLQSPSLVQLQPQRKLALLWALLWASQGKRTGLHVLAAVQQTPRAQ